MKKYIIILLSSVLALSSCSNELDLYPSTGIAPGAVTDKDLSALRWGMYNSVQNRPQAAAFVLNDVLGGWMGTTPKDMINSTLSPLNGSVVNGWNGYYNALYQVNNVIEICEYLEDSQLKVTSVAEARFFRAYIYYCLVTRWGGVPLTAKTTKEKLPRSSAQEVWKQIENDLNFAILNLDKSESYYYVSKDAALALKARVMLSTNQMGEATTIAEKFITGGAYKLDSFEKIFRKKSNTEIIFAFENITEESSINLSDLFYTYAHPNKGQYTYRPSSELINYFDRETNDKRKEITLVNVGGNFCINKYPSGQTGRDPVIISRVAEMYLISAEAQGRANGLARLNELRAFRGMPAVQPASDDAFIDAILDERRIELLAENFAYYDYVRTGRGKTMLGLLDHQLVLPIPGKELQLNTNLVPNPGY